MTSHKNRIFFLGFNNIVDSVSNKLIENGIEVKIITDEKQGAKIDTELLRKNTNICRNSNELLTYFQGMEVANSDIYISVGCPWILKKNHISALKNNVFNLHGTQLPKNRGGTIFSWLILTGNRVGMCLLHKMVTEIDSGPIIDYKEFIYPSACRKPIDYITYYEKMNTKLLFDILVKMVENKYHPKVIQQPEYLSSYWPRLRADVHGWIDWSWDAQEIDRFICAFDEPYGGARCRLNGEVVLIRDVYSQATDGYTHPFQNGLIYRNNNKWLNVAVSEGELLICSITDTSGNDIKSKIKPGDRLFSTSEDILGTRRRVIKSQKGLEIKK